MSDTITIRIRLAEAAKFAGEAHIASAEIDEIGDSAERANRKSRGAAGGMNLLQKSMKFKGFNKADMIVGVLGVLAPALAAASAGAVGLIGVLAPLGGLLATLPGAFLGAAMGVGVLKLALSGVGGALGGLDGELDPKKFAELSTPAQQFVLVLDALKPRVRDLQKSLAGGLFPGLTSGLRAAAPALGVLKRPLEGTARVAGSLGDRLGHLVGSRGFLRDLGDQAKFNNVQLNRLGGGALHTVDGLRQIGVVSRPLISWLTRLSSGWAASADKTLTADRANGKLARTFAVIQRTTGSFFKLLGNTAHALFNIGNIGRKSLGESILGSLVKGSAALKRWTESGPGVKKITRFFVEAKPVLYTFGELLKAIVVDLFKLGGEGDKGVAALFGQLRSEVLPMLLVVTTNLSKLFFFVDKNLPGGAWLLTIGYLLTKLGGGGLIAAAAKGLGAQFGARVAAGLAGEEAAFTAAGSSLGLVFAGGLAAAVIGYGLGKIISDALPNGILGKPEAKPTPTNNAIQGLGNGKGLRVEKGVIKPSRGFPNTHIGGKPAAHGPTVRVYDRLLHKYVNVHPGETLPGPSMHKSAAFTGPTLKAPTTAEVRSTGAGNARGEQPIHVHSHTTLKLNDKPIAEGTNEVVARAKALA